MAREGGGRQGEGEKSDLNQELVQANRSPDYNYYHQVCCLSAQRHPFIRRAVVFDRKDCEPAAGKTGKTGKTGETVSCG